MDVGYTYTDQTGSQMIHRRNITVKTGCICRPVEFDLEGHQQPEQGNMIIHQI